MRTDRRAIVFAPHPDDEILGCGGTIAKKLDEGYDFHVVFLTDGRYGLTDVGISSGPPPLDFKKIRLREAINATTILGLKQENIIFLDFEDQKLRKFEKQAEEKIVKILKRINPHEIYFPQEKEYNIDHRMTNMIVRKATRESGIYPIEYRYIIAWLFPFYLLVHVMDDNTFHLLMSKFLRLNLFRVDISKYLHLKEMALEKYRSQIFAFSNGQSRAPLTPSFLKRFLKNEELFFVSSAMLENPIE
jgi:LmbE family N-acetylglucosaminyl deacetylase